MLEYGLLAWRARRRKTAGGHGARGTEAQCEERRPEGRSGLESLDALWDRGRVRAASVDVDAGQKRIRIEVEEDTLGVGLASAFETNADVRRVGRYVRTHGGCRGRAKPLDDVFLLRFPHLKGTDLLVSEADAGRIVGRVAFSACG